MHAGALWAPSDDPRVCGSQLCVGSVALARGLGIARSHDAIAKAGRPIGEVTNGSPAPWLEKNIGLGYVAVGHSAIGAELEVIIRDTPVSARVVQTPFY